MELKDYCAGLECELTGWKTKIYDVTKKFDRMPSGDKEKVGPQINNLHILLEELTDRIERLNRDCLTQWEPDKIELEGKVTHLKTNWEEVWLNVSPGDFGG